MLISTIARNIIGVVGFPFTIWNLVLQQKNRVEPPGQIIHTTHSDVHVMVTGKGPITVILEAGLSSISIDWCHIQPEISRVARVMSYDRGSYGWSRTRRKSMTSLDCVEEIKEVLEKLNLKPPYILVGHSFGGLSMRLFASMYPDDVVGLVLEDATHENQYINSEENKKRFNNFKRLVTFGYITSLVGLPRVLKQKVGRKFLTKEYEKALKYVGYSLGAYKSIYREYLDAVISANQLIESNPLDHNLPVIVISANNQSEQWNQNQKLLTKLTQNTEHIISNTGHSVHLEDPKVVIESILKLVNLAK